MSQISVGFKTIGFGGFDKRVEVGGGVNAVDTVTEQPVHSADDKRADGVLGRMAFSARLLSISRRPSSR